MLHEQYHTQCYTTHNIMLQEQYHTQCYTTHNIMLQEQYHTVLYHTQYYATEARPHILSLCYVIGTRPHTVLLHRIMLYRNKITHR